MLRVTNDRDFGDLTFNKGKLQPAALIYLRLAHRDHVLGAARIIAELQIGILPNHFVTLDDKGKRV